MARLDIFSLWRGKKPHEAYAQRDATLVEFSKSDGYKAMLDMYEREMRAVFIAFLTETDPVRLDDARLLGRAIYTLIRRVDEKAATVHHAEAMAQFAQRMVGEMPSDRRELADLDTAMFEKSLAANGDVRRGLPTHPDLSGAY